jgi:hypothetical protein
MWAEEQEEPVSEVEEVEVGSVVAVAVPPITSSWRCGDIVYTPTPSYRVQRLQN